MWSWEDTSGLGREAAIQNRVLVIEDDDAVRTMLLTVLEVANYEVRGVRGSVDALRLLETWRPDAIALDVLAPDLDGYRFLDERSRRAELARIPVVVVTFKPVPLPPASQLGVRAVLQQPHDVDALRATIAAALLDPTSPCASCAQFH